MIYEVLDFPIPPPYEVIDSGQTKWNSLDLLKTSYLTDHWFNDGTDEAYKWLRSTVSNDPRLAITVMEIDASPSVTSLGKHIDALNRQFALNYIIDSGGDAPETRFFDDNDNLLKSHVCEVGKWYLLETYKIHDVVGMSRMRKMIAIFAKSSYWQEQQDILSKLLEGRTIKQL